MRSLCLCLLLVVIRGSVADLPPPERTYKILMLLPASSKSHRNVFIPVAEALADRGHQIVMLTNHDTPSKHPNIHEISHGLPYFNTDKMNIFEERKHSISGFSLLKRELTNMSREVYQLPQVKELYAKRKEFSLIVINHLFNEMMYPFAHEMPFITISTSGVEPRQSAVLGNPISTAYFPSFIGSFDLSCVSGRLSNTLSQIMNAAYWRNWDIIPAMQKEIDAHFPGLPSLLDIERNQSLALMNSHFSTDIPVPLLPSQIEVGGMHCRPANPLPEDLKSWIEGAGSAGVIYFSLGSVARGDTMPVEYRQMFVEAFKTMKQRILWKFEAELQGVSKNIMISKWIPQQDILAHQNVKVFISHGGLLSTQEAAYHGTPLLVLPLHGDQPKNGAKIVAKGLGLALVWEELTVEKIIVSLRDIIHNPKYKNNAVKVSELFKDQMGPPMDKAVYWTEYVIRHKGAPELRSPAVGLSWVEFLLLDVLALLILIFVITLIFVRWILRKILHGIFGTSDKKKRKHE